jgi:hypothetical protein
MGLTQEELPYIKASTDGKAKLGKHVANTTFRLQVPLHTLIKLTPMAYGCEEERFSLEIPAVDTHRPKPAARKNSHDAVASAPVEESDTATTTKPGVARDYFGDAAPTATAHTAAPEEKAGDQEQAQHDVQVENEETTKMSAEKARQNILLQHAEDQGKKASEVTQEEASISQADIARALQAQSAMSARKTAHMIKYSDLPKESAENALCAPVAAAGAKKYNRHKMHCPRPECGSLILSTGTADWTVAESGMVRSGPCRLSSVPKTHRSLTSSYRKTPRRHSTKIPRPMPRLILTSRTPPRSGTSGACPWYLKTLDSHATSRWKTVARTPNKD